jgi:Mor family transcriptional regulator
MQSFETLETLKNKANLFREKHGYSLTMDKLLKKYKCKTVDEYRVIRKENKKRLITQSKKTNSTSSLPTQSSNKKKKK